MKKTTRRRIPAILLAAAILLCSSGCGEHPVRETQNAETWSFTDSCGREVELPREVKTVAPSGPLAQIFLYTLCPDQLAGLSTPLTKKQKEYFPEKYWGLPVFGQFYGGGGTISYESVIAAAPDVIIDMGEEKSGIAADMDAIQTQTGIPTVFIKAPLEESARAYDTLGEITGAKEQAKALADYVRQTLDEAKAFGAQIPESQRTAVLFSQGEYGTEVNGNGSLHAQVLDWAAARNVAELRKNSDRGGDEVSMEQILLWNPEAVVLAPDSCYDDIWEDPLWANDRAVKTGAVYEVPDAPYNWLDRPPSVQRILGIRWLGSLLYPQVFQYDMVRETQTFYKLFYHYDLTQAQAKALLAHSTEKMEENA
ncbi:ABC transporter substrate-binding protein [Oscillibacter sp.]|uniref:ABC transporter substrate-binding protein n=1 Tax=Oscillibacter sp. TaxID=1945593 RepID=UPI002897D1D1|nr:ABC transporter substrate-binding protein [Oscillibacter sp.]